MSVKDYAISGLISGAIGDAVLQLLECYDIGNSGLKLYFQQSDPVSSIVHAAVLTGFWSGMYRVLDPQPTLQRFAVFSAMVDVLYRYAYPWIYPSLREYYTDNSFLETIIFNVAVSSVVFFGTTIKFWD